MTLHLHAVSHAPLLYDASLTLAPGELVALLGPNGAGKTTLLRTALGLMPPTSGEIVLDGRLLPSMSAAERARAVAYLPQAREVAWPVAVRDVVALGRFAHGASLGRPSGADAAAVERVLIECDLMALADRRADTLSGGEGARMHLARALAGGAALMLADEPVAALDPFHAHRVLGLLRAATRDGQGVLTVLHDLTLAATYADRLVWIQEGRIVADGSVADTLTVERVRAVYGVEAAVSLNPPSVVVRGLADAS